MVGKEGRVQSSRLIAVGVAVAGVLLATSAKADTWTTATAGQITSGSSTKVGVGQTSPTTELDVQSNTVGREAFRVNQVQSGSAIARFRQNGTDRMLLTAPGNLGIGTTSPSQKLHVAGSIVADGTSSTHGVSGKTTGGNTVAGVFGYAGPLSNGANGVLAVNDDDEAATGLAAFKVQQWGVGTLVPAGSGSAVTAFGGQFAIDSTTGSTNPRPNYAGSAAMLASNMVTDCSGFNFNCAAVVGQAGDINQAWAGRFIGDVDVVGNGYFQNGSFVASDARLKKDVRDLPYGLSEVLKLRPVTYKWKDGRDDRTKLGVIAQEIQKVLPEVVTTNRTTGMLAVEYQEIVPVAVKAIQEQQATIRQQATLIAQMDARIAALEKGRKGPIASSIPGGGLGAAAMLALVPVGLLFARRRQSRTS